MEVLETHAFFKKMPTYNTTVFGATVVIQTSDHISTLKGKETEYLYKQITKLYHICLFIWLDMSENAVSSKGLKFYLSFLSQRISLISYSKQNFIIFEKKSL